MLHGFCRYTSSGAMAESMSFLTDSKSIARMFDEADEWISFSDLFPGAVDLSGTEDISTMLASLQIENFFYTENELHQVRGVLETYKKLGNSLAKKKGEFFLLNEIFGHADELEKALEIIRSVIDNHAQILPYASVEFGKINNEIEKLEKNARQVIRSIFRAWRDAEYTAETDITVRDERLVIPIQAEHKRHVRGFVKDVSATGRVLYIEPMESLELNNRLVELFAESRREKERILRLATAKLRLCSASISQCMNALAHFDWIAARTQLAKRLQANRPQLTNGAYLELKNALNPLLWLKNKTDKKETVPMWLTLDQKNRVMVISGPNAGGKSITLKTALLLQYMAQCGLFITANPESKMGIFKNISVDCGDGQSIDEGLSTFSAHLQHLKKMTSMAGPQSLFGIDELGDGTDPRFGGPIAQAVLETFLQSGALGIVTTHYSRLKEWAGHTEGVINASMMYDTRQLKPLYQLTVGRPGSSFALELLRKTGFDESTISRVETLSGEESGRTEDLLLDLDEKQRTLNEILLENKEKQSQLDHLLEEYRQLKNKIESKRKDILDAAKNKAAGLLNEANKQIELTIRTIREHGADKEKTLGARNKLRDFEKKKITPVEKEKPDIQKKSIPTQELSEVLNTAPNKPVWIPGMMVRSTLNTGKGEILEVKKGKILVAFGLLKMWVNENEIEPLDKQALSKNRKQVSGFDWVGRLSKFSPTLDVRGLNAEEAMIKVRNWMEEAYALGQNQLKIIHGRGDGILRKTLREFFKTLNYLKSYKSEREEQGGDGCTLIELM